MIPLIIPNQYIFNTFVSLFLFLLTYHPAAHAEWFKESRPIMGTEINIELWHDNKVTAEDYIKQVFNEMYRIDLLMSPYKTESELSLINNSAGKHPVKISKELFGLIQKSIKMSELSHGAFDITFASVGYLYDYRRKKAPSQSMIDFQLKNINYKNIKLDSGTQTIYFAGSAMRIDLGGIAKGYAVDRCIEILRAHGITQAMVSAGGDSRILGDKQGRPWMVGIRDPRKQGESSIVIPLKQTSISTSGDYERYFIKQGVRYHHIISPRTGQSARSVRSVTIIGKDAVTTDALSTTVFILGLDKGMQLISKLKGIDAIIINNKGKIFYSPGLSKPSFLKNNKLN